MSALSGQSPSCRVGFPMGRFPASLSTAGTSGEAGSVQGKALVRGLLSLDCMKPTAWPSPAPFSTRTRASSVNAHGNDGVSLSSGFKPKVRAGCDVLQVTYTRDHKAQPAAVRVVETHTVHMHPCRPGTGWGMGGVLQADWWTRTIDALEDVEPGPLGAALMDVKGQRLREVPTRPGRALGWTGRAGSSGNSREK